MVLPTKIYGQIECGKKNDKNADRLFLLETKQVKYSPS
jgi:hypothetical protein